MKRSRHLNTQLKQSNVDVRNYVSELEKEIKRLQNNIAKLEVKLISNQSKISALGKHRQKVVVHYHVDGLEQKTIK